MKENRKTYKETETNIAGYEGDLLTLSVILKEEGTAFTEDDIKKIQSQGKSCILSWCEDHQSHTRGREGETRKS